MSTVTANGPRQAAEEIAADAIQHSQEMVDYESSVGNPEYE